MPVRVARVGHVVLRVRDLDASLRFYRDVLGLSEVARRDFGEGPMVFLSSGAAHHDLALVETGAGIQAGNRLHHFALKIGDARTDLADAKAELDARGCTIHMALDHHVSQGLYVTDPDGNLIELYVDADPELWHRDPTEVANSDPLEL
jgi:catechol 2,3-dioxygenase